MLPLHEEGLRSAVGAGGVICGLLKQRLGGFFFQTLTSPLYSCSPPIVLTAGDRFCRRKTGVKTLLLLTSPERSGGRRVKSWKQYYCGMWTEQKQHFPYWKKKKKKLREPSHLDARSRRNKTERRSLKEEELVQDGWRQLPFPFVLILMPQLGLFALHLQKEKVTGVGTNSMCAFILVNLC